LQKRIPGIEMLVHQLAIDEVFSTLRSHPDGLSSGEAGARLAEFGPNRIERVRGGPAWLRLVRQFTHFFATLLWCAAVLAFVASVYAPGESMRTLGVAIIAVILVNGAFSFWQEDRAERTMAALQRLLPHRVRALRDGSVVVMPSEEVVPGDVIFLTAGDDVPADCRLLEAFGVRVNNATLTGEARPVARDIRADAECDLLASRNVLLAGTSMMAGEAKAVVFATGMHTAFGSIARLTQATVDRPSPLQKEIAVLSRLIAALAVAIGVLVFVIGYFIGLPAGVSLVFSIGIIVANVPEGLLPTVTLAMAMAARRMAARRTLIRHLPCVETLGSATVICTDKTGTLTQNRMQVRSIYVPGEMIDAAAVARTGFARAHRRFLECALHCHDLKAAAAPDGHGTWVGDPVEVALVDLARPLLGVGPSLARMDEIPFDPDRKRLVTIHQERTGAVLFVKGAPEELLSRAHWIENASRVEPLTAQWIAAFTGAATAMADRGLRVLAFGYRVLPCNYVLAEAEDELVVTALVGFDDPPRPEVPAAVRQCRDAGIRIIMVTGDHPHTALAVAREIGLLTTGTAARLLTGADLSRLSDTQLQLALDAPDIVCARVTADQKLRIVQALQRKREIVAVTGDGVNDAPALRTADIGIAMGVSGTEVAREAADMVLLDDNFASIVDAIKEGRTVFENIRKFLTYILTSNIPELVPYLAFALARVPLALTVVQILVVDLGTDLVPALGLGAESPDPAVMRRPPRRREAGLLTPGVLLRAYLFLGSLEAAAAMGAFFFVVTGRAWPWHAPATLGDLLYRQGTTACLTAIVLMQMVNVFLCRSRRGSVFTQPLLSNRLLLTGVAAEFLLILLIDYTWAGHTVFGTAPIPLAAWLAVVPFAVTMLMAEEARKAIVRLREQRVTEAPRVLSAT
jgi:sodium/potassium-transporting ATPase subunit alpha